MEIAIVLAAGNEVGEGPVWDVGEQRLYWVDMLHPAVWSCRADGGDVRTWRLAEEIGAVALRAGGGAVIAGRGGFAFLDLASGRTRAIADPESDLPTTRINDGKVDRSGRFVAGSMDHVDWRPVCGLYRLDPDLSCHRLDEGYTVANGPCWSVDGRTFYCADSWANAIHAYDYEPATGAVSGKRLFASTEQDRGVPDGATVDAEGFVWSAQVFGGAIVRYAPSGEVERRIEFPVMNLTSLAFGGPDLDTLFVTTMAYRSLGLPPKPREAGHLFAIRGLGVRGLPEARFAG
jgi:L-arabinonolactonase